MSKRVKFGINLQLECDAFTEEQLAVVEQCLQSNCVGITELENEQGMTFVNIWALLGNLATGDE